ncbi:MAG: type IV toxin-antitoxin system AbiEi family antitoxin domain-containing protein [Lapillicoccus sp.]
MRAPDLPDVFSRAQARSMGIGDVRLAGLVRRGEIERLRHGVYATARTEPLRPDERAARHVVCARAALSHHASGFVASHLTAAAVHSLPLPLGPTGLVHITAVDATQRTRSAPGVQVHHADSALADVAFVRGVAVTTVARTVADCLRCYGARVSVPIADAALHHGLVAPQEIEEELDQQRCWAGRPRALRSLPLVDGRRESWLESYAYVLFDEWGLVLPEPQVWVDDSEGHALGLGRVDGAWLEDATVLELDGKAKYGEPAGVDVPRPWLVEKVRYDEMGNLGLERVRFSLDDLHGRPEAVRRTIRLRRSVGSRGRFTGSFRLTDPTGLRCLSVSDRSA